MPNHLVRCHAPRSRTRYTRLRTPADSSIITDLASWKFARPSGLFRYRLTNQASNTREVFIKIKPDDKSVLEVAAAVGELSAPGLGNHLLTYGQQTGLTGCHKRELAIYRQNDTRFKKHVPNPYLLIDSDADLKWIIAMEAIEQPIYMDIHSSASCWSPSGLYVTTTSPASAAARRWCSPAFRATRRSRPTTHV